MPFSILIYLTLIDKLFHAEQIFSLQGKGIRLNGDYGNCWQRCR